MLSTMYHVIGIWSLPPPLSSIFSTSHVQIRNMYFHHTCPSHFPCLYTCYTCVTTPGLPLASLSPSSPYQPIPHLHSTPPSNQPPSSRGEWFSSHVNLRSEHHHTHFFSAAITSKSRSGLP